MSILLARIDDKLIHAQITWGWVPLIKPTHLIVVNDEAENDPFRKEILLMAGERISDNTNVMIISKKEAIKNEFLIDDDLAKVLLVIAKPSDAVWLIKNNINIKRISVGYMSEKPEKRKMLGTIFVDEDDIKAFNELIDMGVKLEYQASPQDEPISADVWL